MTSRPFNGKVKIIQSERIGMLEAAPHTKKKVRPRELRPFLTPEERLAAWRQIRGMWKGRKPEPIKELKKIRSNEHDEASEI
jgi:hypothetical protein